MAILRSLEQGPQETGYPDVMSGGTQQPSTGLPPTTVLVYSAVLFYCIWVVEC